MFSYFYIRYLGRVIKSNESNNGAPIFTYEKSVNDSERKEIEFRNHIQKLGNGLYMQYNAERTMSGIKAA